MPRWVITSSPGVGSSSTRTLAVRDRHGMATPFAAAESRAIPVHQPRRLGQPHVVEQLDDPTRRTRVSRVWVTVRSAS